MHQACCSRQLYLCPVFAPPDTASYAHFKSAFWYWVNFISCTNCLKLGWETSDVIDEVVTVRCSACTCGLRDRWGYYVGLGKKKHPLVTKLIGNVLHSRGPRACESLVSPQLPQFNCSCNSLAGLCGFWMDLPVLMLSHQWKTNMNYKMHWCSKQMDCRLM